MTGSGLIRQMANPITDSELDPLYYLANFDRLIDCIAAQHTDLLHAEEVAFIEAYRQQPQNARQLYVRLICRRAEHFVADALRYTEIASIQQAARTLEAANLLRINAPLTTAEIASLLNAPELRRILSLPSTTRKPELAATLAERYGSAPLEHSHWQAWISSDIYTPLGQDGVTRCCLIYFGNLQQDLSQFVVSDLGLQRYETYRLDPHTRPFASREDVDRFLQLAALAAQLDSDDSALSGTADTALLTQPSRCPATERKRNQLIHRYGRELERGSEPERALLLYHTATLPPNRERQVRLLYAQGRYTEAEAACRTLADSAIDLSERLFCQHFLPRIQRKLGGPPVRTRAATLNTESLCLPDSATRVEQQVLDHFAAQGYHGVWCENDLFCALFGLLFWDVIFAPVPGAFSHPFQRAPLDFNQPGFSRRRQALFDARLQEIRDKALWHEIQALVSIKAGIQNPFVRWSRISLPALEALCQRLPQAALLEILAQMAFDPHANRSGFPDLFLWHPENEDYRLIEVKGPGDKLQPAQSRWLTLFDRQALHYAVCYVTRPQKSTAGIV